MSLEQALKELADAIKAQTALLATGKATTKAAATPAKPASAAKAAPAAEMNVEGEEEVPAAKTTLPKASVEKLKAPAPKAKADETADPSYAPVKAAILAAISGGHRTAVTALLKKHGAKTGQDLDPSVYDEVLGELADLTGDLA